MNVVIICLLPGAVPDVLQGSSCDKDGGLTLRQGQALRPRHPDTTDGLGAGPNQDSKAVSARGACPVLRQRRRGLPGGDTAATYGADRRSCSSKPRGRLA